MEIDDWDEYCTNTEIMFAALENCIQSLVRAKNNIVISRTGNVDEGRKVRVELMNSADIENYIECINFRKDVLEYFKKMKKYLRFVNVSSIREVFILDAGFGLTWYEFIYNESFKE